MKPNHNIIALTIHIKGLVQGVGFRPFVYRAALQHHLNGWVVNRTDGVTIKVEGAATSMPPFIEDLRYKAPVVSQIDEITVDQDLPEGLNGFFILASQDLTDETSEISPDIAVCPECLDDMKKQPHRLGFPFINCTNCGPRFSIIKDFPYDRAKTTMESFAMCDTCKDEYTDVSGRRFHAQPVACNNCGPSYTMHKWTETITDLEIILDQAAQIIEQSGIIALKGTGGFHLMCNALDIKAVAKLRKQKRREGKPFAVMFRNTDAVKEYALVSEAETIALNSWRRPIVILKNTGHMSEGIKLGLDTIGAFLPYMPIHYLLFERLNTPAMVLTSGNMADEPVIIDNNEAIKAFSGFADAVITYNRDIYNRTDDSVVRIISGKERINRRSRGYVPESIRLTFDADSIVAAGAELSNTFCIGKGNRAYMSQHIGDLKNYETFAFYNESFNRFRQMYRADPKIIAADMHPDYMSTRFARESGLETIFVQHHHAHIASCMAENGVNEPVIGITFDGTGYGTDGRIWGSEFMTCDYSQFDRHLHFDYMPMPGGDKASEEPWRMGLALLHMAYGRNIPRWRGQGVDEAIATKVLESIEKNINCPLSCGAGRLFDAVAAITGLCTWSHFHAEAPMRLESVIATGIDDHYPFDIGETISFLPAIRQICDDMESGIDVGIISARFHNTVVEAAVKATELISQKTGMKKVALSGGSFQNKYLLEKLESKLINNNFTVYTHSKVPCNDGGLALGQLAIASHA